MQLFDYQRINKMLKILPPQPLRGNCLIFRGLPLFRSQAADTIWTVKTLVTLVAPANNVKKCISLTNKHLARNN